MDRRSVLRTIGLLGAGAAMRSGVVLGGESAPASAGGLPVYDVRRFGAAGNGTTLDTAAINRAIHACTSAGGGTVYVPPGVYRVGTVWLKSNVTLYLEAGATLLGSTDIADYGISQGTPSKGDGDERHLIVARDAVNVTLAGPGRIDGQGPAYWYKSGRVQPTDRWGDVATYDYKSHSRPSPMLEFYNCTNLRIEDVQIENSPGWTLRPIGCTNVFIRGITIRNPIYGLNCDGIDLTCCQNVCISDSHINTADDAICLKSEAMYGKAVRTSKNITITNCVLSCCCNGLKFGTSTFGGFENITVSNCVIANDDVPINQRVISGIAIEMVDGGYVEGVTISNIRMQRVRSPLFIRLGARHAPSASEPTDAVEPGRSFLRGIMIENVHASGSIMTGSVTGQPGNPVQDVTLTNIRIDSEEAERFPGPTAAATTDRLVPELPRAYPEARMFGRLPAHGLYVRHVAGLRMAGMEFRAGKSETRPAVVADDVEQLDVDALRSTPTAGGAPLLHLADVRRALIRGAVAAQGSRCLVQVRGARTQSIAIVACDAAQAGKLCETADDVPSAAVQTAANVTRA